MGEATLRRATVEEKQHDGFTTWCGIQACREEAEFVGMRGESTCFYCRKHAEAFARVNGIVMPPTKVEGLQS